MNPLDGNAIAGALHSFYGAELTTAQGTCRHCGHPSLVAELRIYISGPGTVARCPSCDGVLMVVTEIRGELSIRADDFALAAAG